MAAITGFRFCADLGLLADEVTLGGSGGGGGGGAGDGKLERVDLVDSVGVDNRVRSEIGIRFECLAWSSSTRKRLKLEKSPCLVKAAWISSLSDRSLHLVVDRSVRGGDVESHKEILNTYPSWWAPK
jgi:hypothetical protein